MKRYPVVTVTGLALALLTGCATIGNRVSDKEIAQLYRGMSMPDVRDVLGRPTSDIPDADGSRHWFYTYSQAVSFIFITQGESNTVELVFRDGRLDEVVGYELKDSAMDGATP